ncbi:ABC transporter permease [Kitasatospora sp. NPDC052896]|uniref:ABC transporter permease n=1 Tax=Kitasatospora sp. NPDC052896 TaxID=3364061 RepID=UPI0037C8CF3B
MLLKTSLRSFFAHKGRMALSLIAVVLSVAFVSGTLVFSNTATSTFNKLFASTASDVSVQPKTGKLDASVDQGGKVPTLAPSVVATVAAQPGVRTALGSVLVQNATLVNPATNKAVGPTSGAPTMTGAWDDDPRSPLKITSGQAPHGPGQILLDADTAKKAKLGLGSPLRVITTTGDYTFTVTGIATFTTTNPGAAMAFMDVPTAQQDLLGATAFTSVNAYGDGSRSDDQLKSEIGAAVGGGYDVQTAAEQQAASDKNVGFLDFMKYAMLGFAGISLLVGGFLIINTFSMLVAQRTREIGLLRAIGGSRRQVNQSVLAEALILGVLGSTFGLLAGLGLAELMITLMKAVGMNLQGALVIGWNVPVAAYAIGIVVTLLAAWIPARRAGKISPMAALRDHGTPSEARANRVRAGIGLGLTALGGGTLGLAATAKRAATGGEYLGLGVVLTLVGFVVLGPLLATGVIRVLGAGLPALFGPSGKLAQRNAMRNPRRTGATAAALMIGLALVTGASVVTSSMVSSFTSQLDTSVGADYVVSSQQGGLSPAMVQAARSAPGLAHITEQKLLPADITAPDGQTTEASVAAADPTFADDIHLPVAAGSPAAAFSGGISVDQTYAEKHHIAIGDKLTIDYGKGHTQSLPVELITTEGNQYSDHSFFTSLATVNQAVPAADQPLPQLLLGKAAPGADVAKSLDSLQQSLAAYPQLMVKDQAGYKKLIESSVDGLLNIVYGLLGLAIVVAILGVVNTLALSVVERTREIGLLRAIGLSRRQLRRMVRLESVVIAVFGAVLGTGLGLAWGVTSQRVLRTQGLDVLAIPYGTIVAVLIGAALVGLLAALLPAFRAGRMNVLAAIATG